MAPLKDDLPVIDVDAEAQALDVPWDASVAFPVPKVLSSAEILRLGALTLDHERSEALDQLLRSQREHYKAALAEEGPEVLLEALLDRDRALAQMGRQVADGRSASRLMRELVRGLLNLADYRSVRAVGDATKTGQIEKVLWALGAEPADLRQLRLQGSTLGRLDTPERRAEDLASGTVKE